MFQRIGGECQGVTIGFLICGVQANQIIELTMYIDLVYI